MRLFRRHKKLTESLRRSVELYLALHLKPTEEQAPAEEEAEQAEQLAEEEAAYAEPLTAGSYAPSAGESYGAEPLVGASYAPYETEDAEPQQPASASYSYGAGGFPDADFGMPSGSYSDAGQTAQWARSAPPPSEPLPRSGGRGIHVGIPTKRAKQSAPSMAELNAILSKTESTFSDALLQLIDAHGKSDAQVYKQARISRKHFSKIRGNANYQPSKRTVLALAIALELDIDTTATLLAKAGFAFNPTSKADLIVRYFIERGTYDTFLIDEALYSFDQQPLFS